jgi:hypothetical protein
MELAEQLTATGGAVELWVQHSGGVGSSQETEALVAAESGRFGSSLSGGHCP